MLHLVRMALGPREDGLQRQVSQYMTVSPLTIDANQTLGEARELLRLRQCRHLPVLRGGRLVGILSQRDLELVDGLDGIDLDRLIVEDAMSRETYCVELDAPLDEVAGEMARRKVDAAVVIEQGRVIGVFTTVDALRILSGGLYSRAAAGHP